MREEERKKMFYLTMHSTHFMVIWHWMYGKGPLDSKRGNTLSPHGLLFSISSKGSFICTTTPESIAQTMTNCGQQPGALHQWASLCPWVCCMHFQQTPTPRLLINQTRDTGWGGTQNVSCDPSHLRHNTQQLQTMSWQILHRNALMSKCQMQQILFHLTQYIQI